MLIEDLLRKKSAALITVGPDDTAGTVADLITTNNIGALPVCDADGALVGIISERDIVRGLSKRTDGAHEIKVSDLMTSDVVTCMSSDDATETMAVMGKHHFRHILVVENGRLTAIISSRDVMEATLEDTMAQRNTMANAYEMVR